MVIAVSKTDNNNKINHNDNDTSHNNNYDNKHDKNIYRKNRVFTNAFKEKIKCNLERKRTWLWYWVHMIDNSRQGITRPTISS